MLSFDDRGLIPVLAQDRLTGQVRMVAWMNREALSRTLESGVATFFSRSRGALWTKGETSGNRLRVRSVHADCDGDVLLLLVDPEGPSCHTGSPSCFFRRVTPEGEAVDEPTDATPFLGLLERAIHARRESTAERSYVRALLDGGPARLGEKLREEAGELADAVAGESPERVASEAADLVFHALVALEHRGVPWRAVLAVLADRLGVSGHDEKRARQ